MSETCHRCGGGLSAGDDPERDGRALFCPHCGAPQLLLSDYSEPLSTGLEAPRTVADGSSGALPPSRPNQIDWRIVIRIAGAVSVIAAVLSVISARLPNLSVIGSVWVVSSSLTTLAFYQRRRPLASMNAGVGAKIGVLVGVTLVFALAAALSASLVVARYSLHTMAAFDTEMALAMKAQVQELAATRPIPPESLALIDSVQFRTSMMLISFGLVLFAVLLISIFGGAVGGLLRTRRLSTKV